MSTETSVEASATFPELERHCGSWVLTSPSGEAFEVFDRLNALTAFDRGWQVETVAQYLSRVNQEIRNGNR